MGSATKRLRIATAILLLFLYTLFVLRPAMQQQTGGFAGYYTAGKLLRTQPETLPLMFDNDWFAAQVSAAGFANIYDIFWVNPPTMTLLAGPLSWLPPGTARPLWLMINLVCLLGGLLLLADVLPLPTEIVLWLFVLSLFTPPVHENIRYGQAYLLLFFLLCVVIWGLVQRKTALSGGALGLMLILKTAGAWLVLLLLLTRRWRVLVWAAGTALLVALLSLPWIGIDAWQEYLNRLPEVGTDPKRYVTAYQTLTSLTGHLFVYDAEWNTQPVQDLPGMARGLQALLFVTLLGGSAWGGRRRAGETAVAPATLALFTALIVTSAPVAEGYHYALVLPALFIAGWKAATDAVDSRWWLWLGGAAALLLLPLPYKAPSLSRQWLALLAYPRVYGALLLWGWLLSVSSRVAVTKSRSPAKAIGSTT